MQINSISLSILKRDGEPDSKKNHGLHPKIRCIFKSQASPSLSRKLELAVCSATTPLKTKPQWSSFITYKEAPFCQVAWPNYPHQGTRSFKHGIDLTRGSQKLLGSLGDVKNK